MNRWLKRWGPLAAVLLVSLAVVWGWGWLAHRHAGAAAEGDSEEASRVSTVDGESVLTLDRDTERLSGLVIAPLEPASTSPGVVVPESAIVWLDGQAWLYLQRPPSALPAEPEGGDTSESADRFVRRRVPMDEPVAGGWRGTEGFSPGDAVVVTGAQVLLSEEFRSEIPGE